MTKGEMIEKYKPMSTDEEKAFNKWLMANAGIATIFAVAILAMALSSSKVAIPAKAIAKGVETSGLGGAKRSAPASNGLSPLELMMNLTPGQLPEERIDTSF